MEGGQGDAEKLVLSDFSFRDILPTQKGLDGRCIPFPAPLLFLLFISWMRHLLLGERRYVARRKDTEP